MLQKDSENLRRCMRSVGNKTTLQTKTLRNSWDFRNGRFRDFIKTY